MTNRSNFLPTQAHFPLVQYYVKNKTNRRQYPERPMHALNCLRLTGTGYVSIAITFSGSGEIPLQFTI
jgi:hypothetical protein